jgi:hypothetical protein
MANSWFWLFLGVLAAPFALLGLLLAFAGVFAFFQRCGLILFGERAVGTVVEFLEDKEHLHPSKSQLATAAPTPFLRVAFTDCLGRMHQLKTDTGVSPKSFQVGDRVPLLYRRNHPKTFVVDQLWMKWAGPVLFLIMGTALLVPALAVVGHVWPPLGEWAEQLGRRWAPWLTPLLALGLPALFAFLGGHLLLDRKRRLENDHRTHGEIIEAGWGRGKRYRWIRVAYRDHAGSERTRVLNASARHEEGQAVPLLVDPANPMDVLINEPGELWFVGAICLAMGLLGLAVLGWAWWTGQFPT